ncbi:MAG: acyltransferase [Rhodoferax sp.]|nr:acyltransferase [Rhodoferax sp.]
MHKYLPYVDGLRALAVLSVLLYHLNPAWLAGGFSGVDVFFVISGFIVSVSVSRLECVPLVRFMVFFYARRIQRIFPALVVCLLATTLATTVFIPSAWLSDGIERTGLFAFFGLSNFILASTNKDYFSPAAEFNPFTHTWSLGVEEQFYLIFPFMFFLWGFYGRRRQLSVVLFSVLLIASVGYSAWLGGVDRTSAFYMVTSRFWQLGAGVLLFQMMALRGRPMDAREEHISFLRTVAAWVSLGLVVYGLVASKPQYYAFPGSLPTVLGTLGLLGFLHGVGKANPLVLLLTLRPVLYIGRISYSLYLWHWPVFVLFRWTIGLDSTPQRIAATAIALVLSALSYQFVETPVRRWPALQGVRRGVIVVAGLLCVGTTASVALAVTQVKPHLSISTVTRNAADWYPQGADSDPTIPGCRVQSAGTTLASGSYTTFSRVGCDQPASAAPRVFVIGDSHAVAYIAMYKRYVLQTGATVFVYANGGCPFLSLRPHLEAAPGCQTSSAAAMVDMKTRLASRDVVFLTSLRLPRFSDQWALFPMDQVRHAFFSDVAIHGRQEAEKAAGAVLAELGKTGARIILEAPKPVFLAPPYRCAEPYNQSNLICKPGTSMDRQLLEEFRAPVLAAFSRLATQEPSVSVWDPFAVLCPPGQEHCNAFLGAKPLFFDADHVSGYGNAYLLPHFRAAIQAALK